MVIALWMVPLTFIFPVPWWVVVGGAALAVAGLCLLALLLAIAGGQDRGKD